MISRCLGGSTGLRPVLLKLGGARRRSGKPADGRCRILSRESRWVPGAAEARGGADADRAAPAMGPGVRGSGRPDRAPPAHVEDDGGFALSPAVSGATRTARAVGNATGATRLYSS